MISAKIISIILTLVFTYNIQSLESFGQSGGDTLEKRLVSVSMEQKPLGEVFRYLMQSYDIAIGFEESTLDSDQDDYYFITNPQSSHANVGKSVDDSFSFSITTRPEFSAKDHLLTLNARNEPLASVLDRIVGQMKNYTWHIDEDVVNIYPTKGRNENFRKLLDLKIDSFNMAKTQSVAFLIRKRILELNEVQSFLAEHGIKTSLNVSASIEDRSRMLSQELSFQHITVRDLLNRITRIKRGGWIIRRHRLMRSNDTETVDIDI